MSIYVKKKKEKEDKKEDKEDKKEEEKLKFITQLELGKISGCKHESVKNIIAQNIDPDNPGCGVWKWCSINGDSRVVFSYYRGMAILSVNKNKEGDNIKKLPKYDL